jgi:hypothetical protein
MTAPGRPDWKIRAQAAVASVDFSSFLLPGGSHIRAVGMARSVFHGAIGLRTQALRAGHPPLERDWPALGLRAPVA